LKGIDVKNEISLAQLRGQFIAGNVLLESLLQALPVETLRTLYERHETNAREVAEALRRANRSQDELDAYNDFTLNNQVVIGRIWRNSA
jgi:hypothetical protein